MNSYACLILGGESSGKTTLAKALAEKFSGLYVEEYGRTLYEEKNGQLEESDLDRIFATQMLMECYAMSDDRPGFYDTNALVTQFYKKKMFGTDLSTLEPVEEVIFDLMEDYDDILLCRNDFDFVQDGTRQDLEFATEQYNYYKEFMDKYEIPYTIVEGDLEKRLKIFQETSKIFQQNV